MGETKGIIVTYHIAYTKEVLVRVPGVNGRREAAKLVGKRATWTDPKGVKYTGMVNGLHGTAGTIKVKFKSPLPLRPWQSPLI